MGLSAFNRYRREQEAKLKAEPTVSKNVIVDYEEMTKAEIKEILDEKGIEYSDRDNKATLIELLK